MSEITKCTVLNLLKLHRFSNNEDDWLKEAINQVDTLEDLRALVLLIEMHTLQALGGHNISLRITPTQLKKLFYFETECLDVLCDLIMKILFISGNVVEVVLVLNKLLQSELKAANSNQGLRHGKITNCLIKAKMKFPELIKIELDLKIDTTEFFLKELNTSTNNSVRNFVVSELLINYVQVIDNDIKLEQFLKKLFDLSKECLRLDVFCSLLSKDDIKLPIITAIHRESPLLNNEEFYELLSSALISETYLKKEAIFILEILVHETKENDLTLLYLNTLNKGDYENSWKAFFTLLDTAKEKQLHLITPAISLLNNIKTMHRIWWTPIFTLFLEHSQVSVVYEVATFVLKEWPLKVSIEPTETSKMQVHSFIKLIFKAINKNEHSTTTEDFFQLFTWKCGHLFKTHEYYLIILSEILCHCWCPTALWNLLRSVLRTANHLTYVEYFNKLLTVIINLPHICIRKGCIKLVIDYYFKIYTITDFIKLLEGSVINYLEYFFIMMSPNIRNTVAKKIANGQLYISNLKTLQLCIDILDDFAQRKLLVCKKILSMKEDEKLCFYVHFFQYVDTSEVINYLKLFFNKYLSKENSAIWFSLFKLVFFDDTITEENINFGLITYLIASQEHTNEIHKNIIKAVSTKLHDLRTEIIRVWRFNSTDINPEWVETELFKSYLLVYYNQFYTEINNGENEKKFIISKLESSECLEKVIFDTFCDLINSISKYDSARTTKILDIVDILVAYLPRLKSNKYFKEIITKFITAIYSVHFYEIIIERNLKSQLKFEELCTIQPYFAYIWIKCVKNLTGSANWHTNMELLPHIIETWLQVTCVKKEQRIEYEVCKEVQLVLGDIEYLENPNNISASIRVLALESFVNIASKKYKYNLNCEPAEIIITKLFAIILPELQKRYFPDSDAHFRRLRIFQAILILLNCLSELSSNKFILSFIDKLFAIILESTGQQNDVRQIIQWAVLYATQKLPQNNQTKLIECIMELLKKQNNDRATTISSLIFLLYQLTVVSEAENVWCDTVGSLMPFTMGASFKTRVHSQEAIKTLICLAKARKYGRFLQKFGYLENVINACINSATTAFYEALKSDSILYTAFNFIQDYSIESIFITLPKLNSTFPFEWDISLNMFSHNMTIPILNTNKDFSQAVDTYLNHSHRVDKENSTDYSNFQLKITPWKSHLYNSPPEISKDFVLVASLIDKPQNLGGLMRTCEVYGVKQIVLHDAKIVNSKEFKSLSMSSEHWMDILEVKVPSLEDFLINMKKRFYTIVGAEQTCDSKKLTEYKFEKNTVLVLGNEKEGISPNIVSLMDMCVEIPQLGQIRSLNVHVAGAIFIWEYMKQHKL